MSCSIPRPDRLCFSQELAGDPEGDQDLKMQLIISIVKDNYRGKGSYQCRNSTTITSRRTRSEITQRIEQTKS